MRVAPRALRQETSLEPIDDPDDLPEPEELLTEAIEELNGAVAELKQVLTLLENGNEA